MSTRWMRLGWVGAGVSLLAACGGEQVWLGQARHNLDDCEGAECSDAGAAQPAPPLPVPVQPPVAGQQPPTYPVQPPTYPQPLPGEPDLVEVAVLDRCSVPVSGELSVEQHITDVCGGTAPGSCGFLAQTLTPGADGDVWIIGAPTSDTAGTPFAVRHQLLRYGSDGSLRCHVEVPSGRPSIAIADNGHAWLASQTGIGALIQVQRYDDNCQAVGGPIGGLNEVQAIANVPGAGVAIAHGLQSSSAVTLIDQNGQVLWSRPGTGDRAAIAGAAGSTFLLGSKRRRGTASGITVHALDALGSTRWQTISQGNASWVSFPNYLAAGHDQQGNLMLAFVPTDAFGQKPLDYYADVESIDASGQTRWVLRVPVPTTVGAAVAPTGEVYVAGPNPYRPDTPMTIAVIARDGSSCSRLAYDGPEINKLVFSSSGRLWYASIRGLFGRFGPLP